MTDGGFFGYNDTVDYAKNEADYYYKTQFHQLELEI
jgi:hypothetical protein